MRALEVNGAPSPQPSPGGSGGKRNAGRKLTGSGFDDEVVRLVEALAGVCRMDINQIAIIEGMAEFGIIQRIGAGDPGAVIALGKIFRAGGPTA